jgi:hypothetical protein
VREKINLKIGPDDSINTQVKSESIFQIKASKLKFSSHIPIAREVNTLCKNIKNESVKPAGS